MQNPSFKTTVQANQFLQVNQPWQRERATLVRLIHKMAKKLTRISRHPVGDFKVTQEFFLCR